MIIASALSDFGDGVRFIFKARESSAGTVQVGGLDQVGHMAGNHLLVSSLAIAIAIAIALPIALLLGHKGRGEFIAISTSNVGRAVPSLAIIAFFVAFLGTGFTNLCFALILLAIPPILTNTYVAVRQVDRDLVDAARGQGLSEAQITLRIELPLALPTIFGGIRLASVNVLATAIIGPLAGYETLGTPILALNVYGFTGAIGAAIVVALMTLVADVGFAGVQRLSTPKGLKVVKGDRRRMRLRPTSQRSA